MDRNRWPDGASALCAARSTQVALVVLAGFGAGCANSAGTTPWQGATDSGASGDDGGTTSGDDSSTVPPGDDGGGGEAAAPGVALPFYVSDEYVPAGFMGDSMASMTAITVGHDVTQCKLPRQSGVGGDCYKVTWAPSLPDGGAAWAGVYWQSPANNWGAHPGKAISPGATKVSFYAAGAVGGESIQLCAGGINSNGTSATLPYGDTFSVKHPAIALTTTWTQYEVSLAGTSYTDVLGAFCWVASTNSTESITFYIDDLKWE